MSCGTGEHEIEEEYLWLALYPRDCGVVGLAHTASLLDMLVTINKDLPRLSIIDGRYFAFCCPEAEAQDCNAYED